MLGEQALPVRSEDAAPETRNALPLSRVIWLTASATPEFGTSTIDVDLVDVVPLPRDARADVRLVLVVGRHDLDLDALASRCPKSSTAIRAATTEPAPARSVYRLDMSVRTPILITSSDICACAVPAPIAAATASRPVRLNAFMLSLRWGASRALIGVQVRCPGSNTEIVVQLGHVRLQVRVRNHVDHAAVIHHVMPVRDRRREAEILLDQQDREALRLELARSCGRSAARSPARGPRSARRAAAAARRCAGCGRSPASAARRPRAWSPGSSGAPSGSGTARRSARPKARPRAPPAAAADSPRRRGSRRSRAPRDSRRCRAARSGSTRACRSPGPSNAIEPSRRGTMPMIDFSVVVLPAPLRPSSVTTSPAGTSNVTPCSTCDSPYQALSSRTASSGAPAAPERSRARPSRDRQASAVPM